MSFIEVKALTTNKAFGFLYENEKIEGDVPKDLPKIYNCSLET